MLKLKDIKTKEGARQYAIEWQSWQSEQNLSWHELSRWQDIMRDLAVKYGLMEEFKENGII